MRKSDPELNKKRGARLSECRKAVGLTQQDLAERLHYSKQTISYIETGARSLTENMAWLIGQELAVDPDYLLCNTDIASFKQFFTDNMSEGAKAPVKSQILYDLIKANPDCAKIEWCVNARGEKNEWGWHIDALIKTHHEGDPFKSVHLDNATQIKLFDELSDFVRYQLFKQKSDPDENLFSYAFSGESGAGYSAEEFQKAVDRYKKEKYVAITATDPVLYDESKREEA